MEGLEQSSFFQKGISLFLHLLGLLIGIVVYQRLDLLGRLPDSYRTILVAFSCVLVAVVVIFLPVMGAHFLCKKLGLPYLEK